MVPASNASKEATDQPIFLISKFPMFNIWPQIVEPSQSATFPTSL